MKLHEYETFDEAFKAAMPEGEPPTSKTVVLCLFMAITAPSEKYALSYVMQAEAILERLGIGGTDLEEVKADAKALIAKFGSQMGEVLH